MDTGKLKLANDLNEKIKKLEGLVKHMESKDDKDKSEDLQEILTNGYSNLMFDINRDKLSERAFNLLLSDLKEELTELNNQFFEL